MYTNPPLAGKPPFATDEPDSVYEGQQPIPRAPRQKPVDPNARTSAYDVYDNYTEGSNRQSGVGALGLGLLNMDDSDDEDDEPSQPQRQQQQPSARQPEFPTPQSSAPSLPVAAPRPGYAVPVNGLTIHRPQPAASPEGRLPAPPQPAQAAPGLRIAVKQNPPQGSPYASMSPVPSTPHPLQPPMTPILPAFARPPKAASPEVKFAVTEPIMRGNSEDALIPKRGEQGDDFWRRFSMVAKEENKKPKSQKESPWLKKTNGGTNRLSRMVWVIGVLLLLCIGAASGLGWYLTRGKPQHQQPTAIGGSANQVASSVAPSSTAASVAAGKPSSSPRVHPTNTVARRSPEPTQLGDNFYRRSPAPPPPPTWRSKRSHHHRR